jgi:hypothetical protein
MNESLIMKKQQLEMGLDAAATGFRCRPRRRQKRAQWWFQQMRVLVNQAADWKPADEDSGGHNDLALSRSH